MTDPEFGMKVIRIIMAAAATYRLSQLFAYDVGPFEVFKRLRTFLGRKVKSGYVWFNASELIHCPYCLGVWFAACTGLLAIFHFPAGDVILVILGIAGIQCFMQDLANGRE